MKIVHIKFLIPEGQTYSNVIYISKSDSGVAFVDLYGELIFDHLNSQILSNCFQLVANIAVVVGFGVFGEYKLEGTFEHGQWTDHRCFWRLLIIFKQKKLKNSVGNKNNLNKFSFYIFILLAKKNILNRKNILVQFMILIELETLRPKYSSQKQS